MRTLYELDARLELLYDLIEENDGEITKEQEDLLKELEEGMAQEFESKALAYSKYITKLNADIAYAESEVKRINKYKATKLSLKERLQTQLVEALMKYGTKDKKADIYRAEIGTFKLSTRKTKSVDIFDETLIEDKWKRLQIGQLSLADKAKILEAVGKEESDVKIVIDILKTPIKKAIEAEEEVKGARIKTEFGLTVK